MSTKASASEKLGVVSELVNRYQGEVPEVATELSTRLSTMALNLETGTNPVAIEKECDEIRYKLTVARCRKTWNDVKAAEDFWRNGPLSKPYCELEIAKDVLAWLGSSPSDKTEIKEILDWIKMGKGMILQLGTPWGRCVYCHRVLKPKCFNGTWRVFDTCGQCHWSLKNNPLGGYATTAPSAMASQI